MGGDREEGVGVGVGGGHVTGWEERAGGVGVRGGRIEGRKGERKRKGKFQKQTFRWCQSAQGVLESRSPW